jgi:hypothetical protein
MYLAAITHDSAVNARTLAYNISEYMTLIGYSIHSTTRQSSDMLVTTYGSEGRATTRLSAPHIKHLSMWDPYGEQLLACLACSLKPYFPRKRVGVHPN